MPTGDEKKRLKLLKRIKSSLNEGGISDEVILNRVGKFTNKKIAELENKDLENFLRLQKLLNRTTSLMHGISRKLIFSTFSLYSGIRKHENSPFNAIRWISIVLRAIAIALISPVTICTIIANHSELMPIIDELFEEIATKKGEDGKEDSLEISEKNLERIFEITEKFLSQRKFFEKLGSKKNVESILNLVLAEYNNKIKTELKDLDKEIKELKTKQAGIGINEKNTKSIKEKINEAAILRIQQRITTNLFGMLKEQMAIDDFKLADLGEGIEFINSIIRGTLKQKEGDFIERLSQSIASVLVMNEGRQIINKDSLKYFITEFLTRNYQDIQGLVDLPKIQDEKEIRMFIESAIDSSMDVLFDLTTVVGKNSEIIKQVAKVISGAGELTAEIKQFQEESISLMKGDVSLLRNEASFKVGENVKNAIDLIILILEDHKTLGKSLTQENFIKLCSTVDKFIIDQQIASLEMQNEMLPQAKKLTPNAKEEMTAKEIESAIEANKLQIKTLQLAKNILQKRSKEIHAIFGKDVGKFLKGMVETLKPNLQNPLTIEDMLLQVATQATHSEIIKKDELKTLIRGIINDNHELISGISKLIPKIKDDVSRETFVKHAVNTSVEMLFALGPAVEENKSLAKQVISFGFEVISGEAKEFTEFQQEMIDVAKDIIKQHSKELNQIFGAEYKDFIHTIRDNLKPKQVVDKDGKTVTVEPNILDIISGILSQSNKLDIVQKDKLKDLLKAIINEHKASFRKHMSESVGSALFFENIPDEQERAKKVESTIDTLVDTMYEVTSAIGKNSEVSTQIVQALFEIVQSPKKEQLKSKKGKPSAKMSKKEEEEKQKRDRAVAKQRFKKVMQLIEKVTDEDRGKVIRSVLKLVSTVQIPGVKDLVARLQIGNSEIFSKYLPDAFKDQEFCRNFSEKLADILYPMDNKTTLENAAVLVNYINEFYKSNPSISKAQYEKEIVPQLIEIGFGITRQFNLLDAISGYPSDLVVLFESLAKQPNEVTTALKAGAQYLKSGIFGGLYEVGFSGIFNLLKAGSSTAFGQLGSKNFARFAQKFTHEVENATVEGVKFSSIMEGIKQQYGTDAPEAFYLRLGYIPNAKFEKSFDLTKVSFDQDIDFHKCDFQGTVKLNAANCNAGKLKFLHCTFSNLELDVSSAQDVKNAVRVIGVNTFNQLIEEGKITVNLKITAQDKIDEIRRAFATTLPVEEDKKAKPKGAEQKSDAQKEVLLQDNFSALLLTGKIDFQNSLSEEQQNEVSSSFYKSMSAKDKKIEIEPKISYRVSIDAQKQYAKHNVNNYKQFKSYTQYTKPSFVAVILRNISEKKKEEAYITFKLFSNITKKYAEVGQLDLLIHQGKDGSITIDPKVRNVIDMLQMLYPPVIACKYSDRFAVIIEKHGIDAIEKFQELSKLIEERSKDQLIFKSAMQIIIDDMVIKLIDNQMNPENYFNSIIEQVQSTEKVDFDIKKLSPNSLHHTLLDYGIEDSMTHASAYDMIYQMKDDATKEEMIDLIKDILLLEIKDLPKNVKPHIRTLVMNCMSNAFKANRSTLLDKLKNGEVKEALHSWVNEVIEEEKEANKGWTTGIFGKKEIGESFKNIPLKNIFNIFQGTLKLDATLLPELKKVPEVASASLYDFLNPSYYISGTACSAVENVLVKEQGVGERSK